MAVIPDKYVRSVGQEKAGFAGLATVIPERLRRRWDTGLVRLHQRPHSRGRRKGSREAAQYAGGSPVALSIMDPDNAIDNIQVRGKVSHIAEQGANAHIDSLAKKYFDKDKYPFAQPGEVRVLFKIPRNMHTV